MQLISLFSLLLLGLISEIAATTLDLNTRADSNDDNDNAKDMITVTLLDCNPDTRFYSYRFVCSNSTTVDEDGNEKPNRNTCESQQQLPSDVLSPPSGSKGIPNWLAPLEDTMPKGCEPGPEGLGPIGQMRVEVGSEIWFGVVVFPESKDDDDNPKTLDVESRAMQCHFKIDFDPGDRDHQLYWWFNSPELVEIDETDPLNPKEIITSNVATPFAARNGQLIPGAVTGLTCVGRLQG